MRSGGADHLEVRQRPWGVLVLSDCVDPATAGRVARRLTQAFGHDQDAWIIAFLLLREGWDAPLAELAPVVAALVPDQEVAA